MNENHYHKVAEAIQYIYTNFKNQPGLEEIAAAVNLSPMHFQRVFQEWAGVSPKKFLQFITVEHAKKVLKQYSNLSEAAYESGLSGTGRLHDLFITMEAMTPGEYKDGGKSLTIEYSYQNTSFGRIICASTERGLCNLIFADENEVALQELKSHYPKASYIYKENHFHTSVAEVFSTDVTKGFSKLKFYIKGTPFQFKVWKALLEIPEGEMFTYSDLAIKIGNPKASRAVGSAVGDNPIAFLIPCHRVIKSTGEFGQYHWGSIRKTAILGWEASKNELRFTKGE